MTPFYLTVMLAIAIKCISSCYKEDNKRDNMKRVQMNLRVPLNVKEWIYSEAEKDQRDPGWWLTNLVTTKLMKGKKVSNDQKKENSAQDTELQILCKQIWNAYSIRYFDRYSTNPVRNTKVNGQIKQLAQRLGQEAVDVARFYVGINDSWLIKNQHDVGTLLSKAEAYRTQWANGQAVTGITANQLERTQSNYDALEEAKRLKRAKSGQ